MPDEQIVIISEPIDRAELEKRVAAIFGDMVKVVVDIQKNRIAIGGELHADAEALLLAEGSVQSHLWGANYYPGLGAKRCVETTALINIRPSQDNPGMEIMDPEIRQRVVQICHELIGRGDEPFGQGGD
jgi:hypothetical protein